ncbi:hypothetical protein DENSPDRAFT_877081 [Dentipellis sp. KUC8613]|nr:hypothetical protein DENSPDRAFT_877081 [Dentipellis sp. KUC8613]
MIGRKIVEFRDDDFGIAPAPVPLASTSTSTSPSAYPSTGLHVPRSRKPLLRINTEEDDETLPTILIERTNVQRSRSNSGSGSGSSRPNRRRRSSASALTPDTSFTFGCPNPTASMPSPTLSAFAFAVPSPHPPPSPSPLPPPTQSYTPSQLAARRTARYTLQEAALSAALARCRPSHPPRDAQLSALARALAAARRQEARDRVAALREVMADEGLDNATCARLQRERWLEERWLAQAESEAEAEAQGETKTKTKTKTEAQVQVKGKAKQPTTAAKGKQNATPAPAAEADTGARRRANLARFFAASPTQTAILSSARTLRRAPLPEPRVIASPRDVEPPLLRAWPFSETLRRPMRTPRAAWSLGSPLFSPRPNSIPPSTPTSTSTPTALQMHAHAKRRRTNVPTPLDTLPELPSDAEPHANTGTSTDTYTYTYTGTGPASAPPTASTSAFPSASSASVTTSSECGTLPEDLDLASDSPSGDGSGYATIFRLALRPRSEILAELQMQVHAGMDAPMPAYVADLLDQFDGVGVGVGAGSALLQVQDDGTPHASPAKITFSVPVPRMRMSEESASLLSYDGGLELGTPPRTPQRAAFAQPQHAHAHTSPFRRSLGLARKLSAARLRGDGASEPVSAGVLGHRRSFLRHRHFRSEGPVDGFGVKSPEQVRRDGVARTPEKEKEKGRGVLSRVRERMSIVGYRAVVS